MSDLPKINVVIPAYKAQNTILRTLSSIATQNVVDDCEVIIVNDADGIGYKKFVDMFKPYMNIREVVLETNGGPGDARQKGIEEATCPLITFIDADDTFSGAFALKTLRAQLLAEPYNAVCYSQFLEEQPNTYVGHPQNSVWMFGAMYKMDFIKKYNIHFLPGSRGNEDNGFNMMCKLCANQFEQVKFIPDITYYWHWKEDSITRINNAQYSYDKSYVGYTNNMIFAIKEAEKSCPFNGAIMQQKVSVMCNLYEYLIETEERDVRFYEQNWNCCRKYYAQVYREIKDKINDQIFAEIYAGVMKNSYMGDKMFRIIPKMGIREFMNKLEELYDPNEKDFPMTDDSTPYPTKDEGKSETKKSSK